MSYAKYVLVPIMKKYGIIKKDGTLNTKNVTSPAFSTTVISVKKKSEPQTVNVTVPKSKPVKYASIGRKQMRMGRSGTVVTSGGLLVNKNMKIKKKKLLGE
jgi:hypothetical protein